VHLDTKCVADDSTSEKCTKLCTWKHGPYAMRLGRSLHASKEKFGCGVLVLFLVWCCFELKTHRIGTVSNTHDSKAGCVGFILVLSGKPMCIGCLSLGACLLVENYSMKTMESSCSHVRNITCQTSAMTHTREAFAFQGKV